MPDAQADHDRFREDLAAYALGSLDAASTRQLEIHLLECDECREMLAEYQQIVQLLPLGLEPIAPPQGADQRLLDRARDLNNRTPARRYERPLGLPQRWVLPAAAGLVALLLGGVAALVALFGDDEPAGVHAVIRLSGSENAPEAVGQLIVRKDGTTELVVSDLPPPEPGEAYQFWFVQPDNTRMSGGVFSVDENGETVVVLDMPYESIYQFDRVGVTVEPEGGSPGPTGENVLMGRVQGD